MEIIKLRLQKESYHEMIDNLSKIMEETKSPEHFASLRGILKDIKSGKEDCDMLGENAVSSYSDFCEHYGYDYRDKQSRELYREYVDNRDILEAISKTE